MGNCISYGSNYIDLKSIEWPDNDDNMNKQNRPTEQKEREIKANDNILKVMSWNIAGINNNPWEYFVCLEDDNYNNLMSHIESFLTKTGKQMKVRSVLESIDSDFFGALQKLLSSDKLKAFNNLNFDALIKENVSKYLDLSIPDFLSNKFIGENRLISWPDRLLSLVSISYSYFRHFQQTTHRHHR